MASHLDNLVEASVLISLSTTTPDGIAHPERRIVLNESRRAVMIGRSSNRSSMALESDTANGWFNSPVMSRHHAQIEADISNKAIFVRDAGSMHGTYLNKDRIGSEKATALRQGDELTFGLPVYRNQRTFKPVTVEVGLEFLEETRASVSRSRVFTVPDDCSTDDNEPLEDYNTHKITSDPDAEPCGQPSLASEQLPQMDGVVDLAATPSDAASQSSHLGGDPEGSEDGHQSPTRDGSDHSADDDESIILSDNGAMSSPPPSSTGHVNSRLGSHDDGEVASSRSWNSISSDSEDEHMDDELDVDARLSDHEQGLFLYSSDSEEIDEDYAPDDEFDMEMRCAPKSSINNRGCGTMLPSISTFVSPNAWSCSPPRPYEAVSTVPITSDPYQGIVREPSPSDAVFPFYPRRPDSDHVGCAPLASINPGSTPSMPEHHIGNNGKPNSTVETLGQKTGKTAFFEAREHNKMTIARLTEASVPEASHVAKFRWQTHSPKCTVSSVSKVTSNATEDSPSTSSAVRPLSPIARPLLDSSQPHTDMSVSYRTNEPERITQGKRKLAEISTGTEEELASIEIGSFQSVSNGEMQEAMEFAVNSREAPDVSSSDSPRPSNLQSPLPSPLVSPEELVEPAERPHKRMKQVAERIGYAALGGATVGAVVLTSLIYTAPSFV